MQFKAVGGVRINVAVLAYDDKVLWDCRNFLYDFIDKTNYNLGITQLEKQLSEEIIRLLIEERL